MKMCLNVIVNSCFPRDLVISRIGLTGMSNVAQSLEAHINMTVIFVMKVS